MAEAFLRRKLEDYRPDLLLYLGCLAGSALWLVWLHNAGRSPPFSLSIGIATAGLLLGGISRWPAVALGVLTSFFLVEPSRGLVPELIATAALTFGGICAASIVQQAGVRRGDILDPRGLLWVIVAAGAGAVVAAAIGTLGMAYRLPTDLSTEFLARAMRLLLGLLLAAPLVLVWATPASERWSLRSWGGFVAIVSICVAVSCWCYLREDTGPIAWLPYPALIAAALGFHLRGATTTAALASLIALWGTSIGRGPFALAHPDHRILLAQGFVAITSATMMLLAAYADKRRIEERRLLAEQRYRAVFEQAGVGVSIHSLDGRYLDINDRGLALSGYSREELIGADYRLVLGDASSEDPSRALGQFAEDPKGFTSRDVNLRTKNGEMRAVNVTANIVRRPDGAPDHLIAVAQDISERVRAERALSESEKRLRLAQEAAGVGVWEIDLVHGGARHSPESAHMFGVEWRHGTYRMVDFADILGDAQIAVLRQAIATARREQGPMELTFKLSLRDGGERWVRLHGSYDAHDGEPRLLGLAVDVTRDVKAQAQLREAHEKLLRVARLSAMGAMASTLAHELNQPLSAVTNYVETCRYLTKAKPDPDPAILDALERARDQTLRAADIIKKIRAFTITGKITRQPIDLNAIVGEACLALQRLRVGEGVSIECHFDDREPPLLGDPLQLEQVIGNLARNAVEATDGRPRREVTISTITRDRDVLVEVRDTGAGLSEEMLGNLFEPFRTSKESGTGLGLPICRTIIEAHGGRLWAENGTDGAILSFTIPIANEREVAED